MNLKILLKRNPLLLILGGLVSAMGSRMQAFALSLYVLDKTGSGSQFASVLAVSMIPIIVIGPFAGAVSDRFSRKKMIVLLDALSGIVTLCVVGYFYITNTLPMWAVYTLVIALSTISTFFNPCISAMVPDAVGKENISDVNSSVHLIFSLVGFTAPILGGILYGAAGIMFILLLNGISYLLSAFSEMFIKLGKETLDKNQKNVSYFSSLKEGFTYMKTQPAIIMLLFVALVGNFAFAPIASIGVSFVLREEMHMSEFLYGAAQSIAVIGSVIGAFFVSNLLKKHHFMKLITRFMVVLGIFCIGIGIAAIPSILAENILLKYSLIVSLVVLLYATISITSISSGTGMQKIVPGEKLGRVFGLKNTIGTLAVPIGQILFGLMLDNMLSYIAIIIFASILLLTGVVGIPIFNYQNNIGNMEIESTPETVV